MKNKGIIHCDIKPENILFTDENADRVKIIDLGTSCEDYKTGFSYVQSRMYRAPEVVLGIPYSHPIDMWSLGCVLFELVNGTPLFPAKDENELLEYFTITLGEVPAALIRTGKNHENFFNYDRSRGKYELIRSTASSLGAKPLQPRSQTIDQILVKKADAQLIDFIKRCLNYAPEKRMTPEAALSHPFIKDI